MKLRMLVISVLAGLSLNHLSSFSGVLAQQNSPAIDNLYHIAMNGIEIVVDGELKIGPTQKWLI